MKFPLSRFFAPLIALFLLFAPAFASAQVTMTFYSHDFGNRFPHTFFTLKGTIPETGEVVDSNYGFTAKNVSPALLFGSVIGLVDSEPTAYIEKSDPQFALVLTEPQYRKIMALVAEWRNRPQKSYNLNKRNCIHFVMEAAALLDLQVNRKSKYFKKPKTFLREVIKLNPTLVALSPETPEKDYKKGKIEGR
jgi:hypothetical protein